MFETPNQSDENASPLSVSRNDVMVLSLVMEGGMGALAILVGWLVGVPFFQTIHLAPPQWSSIIWGTLFALLGAALALGIQRLPFEFAGRLREKVEEIANDLLGQCNVPDLIGLSLLAGVGEELLFRGLIQQGLSMVVESQVLVIGLVAVLFGLLHSLSVSYIIAAAIASVGLSLLFVFTNDLVSVMVCHAVYDLILLLVAKSHFQKDQE